MLPCIGCQEAKTFLQTVPRPTQRLPLKTRPLLTVQAHEGGNTLPTAGRDFGGSRESIDIDAEATAAREFAEETLGVFASMAVDACAGGTELCIHGTAAEGQDACYGDQAPA